MHVLEDRAGRGDNLEDLKAETSQSVKATCCIIALTKNSVSRTLSVKILKLYFCCANSEYVLSAMF
jgi:hypothetical protein